MATSSIYCTFATCVSRFPNRNAYLHHIRNKESHHTPEFLNEVGMKLCSTCLLPFTIRGFEKHACKGPSNLPSTQEDDGDDSSYVPTPQGDLMEMGDQNDPNSSNYDHEDHSSEHLDPHSTSLAHVENLIHTPHKQLRGVKSTIIEDVRLAFKRILNELLNKAKNGLDYREDVLAFLCFPILINNVYSKRGGKSADTECKKIMNKIRAAPNSSHVAINLLGKIQIMPQKEIPKKSAITQRFVDHLKVMVGKQRAGKALSLLESRVKGDTIAQGPEVHDRLQALFPPRSEGDFLPQTTTTNAYIILTKDDILAELSTLPRLSAPGFTGWTYELIQQLLYGEASCIDLVVQLFNYMLLGRMSHGDLWFMSKLIPVEKGDGQKGIRPLVVGDVWYRVLARIIARSVREDAEKALAPFQLGVATRGACEGLGHVANLFDAHIFEESNSEIDLCILSIDFRNAFNSIHRSAIYSELIKVFPKLVPLFKFAYGMEYPIYFSDGTSVCVSGTGIRQGDPLGPLYFALGIQEILRRSATNGSARVFAYLDDINLFGNLTDCLSAYDRIRKDASKIGLILNPSKSVIHSKLQPDFSNFPYHPTWSQDGIKILGVPVGNGDYVRTVVQHKLEKASAVLPAIQELEPGLGLSLINQCINVRPIFIARTIIPSVVKDHLMHFDTKIDLCLAKLCKHEQLNEVSASVRHLPVDRGGIGVRRIAECEPHFSQSFLHAYLMMTKLGALDFFNFVLGRTQRRDIIWECLERNVKNFNFNRLSPSDAANPLVPPDVVEKNLLSPKLMNVDNDNFIFQTIVNKLQGQPERLSWFLSQAHVGTAPWLSLGCSSVHLYQMDSHQFSHALSMRLLMPLTTAMMGKGIKCKCGFVSDLRDGDFGYHAINCKFFAELRTRRHDWCASALEDYVTAMGFKEGLERKPKLTGNDTTLEADLKFVMDNVIYTVDLSICNPTSLKYRQKGSDHEGGVAALYKEELKRAHYAQLGTDVGGEVIPFILEASGRLGPAASKLVDHISDLDDLVETPDRKKKYLRKFFFGRLSVHLIKGNAYLFKRYCDNSTYVDM